MSLLLLLQSPPATTGAAPVDIHVRLSPSQPYEVGDLVRLTAVITNPAAVDALVNPTTVVCRIRPPDSIETARTLSPDSTGVYHFDININESSVWVWRFECSGNYQGTLEGKFSVLATAF